VEEGKYKCMDALRRGCTELATTFCQTFNATSPIQDMWTFIKTHLLKLQDQHVPSKQSTRYSQSWINREVKSLSRKKKCSYDKARRTGNAKDLRRYKHLKQLSTEACRRAYNSYITNIISPDSIENPKRFWGFIKGLRTENTGIAPLKDSTGMTQSVFNKDEQCDSIPNKGPSPFNDMPAIIIGLEGVYKILNQLQIHKATGPDKISCRILKEMAAEVAPILHLFCKPLSTKAYYRQIGKLPMWCQYLKRETKAKQRTIAM
jgi:hypothetical protein